MCGLAGFANIKSRDARDSLVWALGYGVDTRGGDAAGFVSVSSDKIRYGTKPGTWIDARDRFYNAAARGDVLCLMHARYATCGDNTVDEAHPFAVRREGKVKLYGAHNGMIYNAVKSAHAHGRPYDVDSRELFELLADGQLEKIQNLDGYGVITWIDADKPKTVNLSRLTKSSEIYVVATKCGGTVWGSTRDIVDTALIAAGLKRKHTWDISEIGRVYEINVDGVTCSNETGVKLSDTPSYLQAYKRYSVSPGWQNWNEDDTDDLDWKRWEKNWEAEEKQKEHEEENKLIREEEKRLEAHMSDWRDAIYRDM